MTAETIKTIEVPYELEFTIEALPPILANGSHKSWQSVNGIKRKWQRNTIALIYDKRPRTPLKRAKVTFTRHSMREPDYDNLVISFKAIRDGLVKGGILEDDNSQVLKSEYRWEKTKKNHGFVSIKVEEI